jgi:prepilin-type processing-associated H-X9-DG protein
MALRLYANDFDDRVPARYSHGNAAGTSAGSVVLWPRFISGYNIYGQAGNVFQSNGVDVETTQYLPPGPVYACPISVTNEAKGYGKHVYYGYGMYNAIISRNAAGQEALVDSLGFTFARNISLIAGRQYPKIQVHILSAVRNSQSVMWLGDTTCKRNFGDAAAFNDSGVGRQIGSFHPTDAFASIFGARVYLVHDKKANVAFYDGHVERMAARQMMTETLSKAAQFYNNHQLLIPEQASYE